MSYKFQMPLPPDGFDLRDFLLDQGLTLIGTQITLNTPFVIVEVEETPDINKKAQVELEFKKELNKFVWDLNTQASVDEVTKYYSHIDLSNIEVDDAVIPDPGGLIDP